ncbi:transcription factor DIVARICATA-like [Neltuma alba]|uniref:transcription factor DIVARICATA-like n=1 Tax=Neltuma alba TaxID=207710 RepID=UPI0010A5633D|nr:transcription factor DIVARICATA-like [Prosopis alba]XP_028792630.1 transcription factor DIVARICATA-like [Prosopis alba]
METLYPSSFMPNSDWHVQDSLGNTEWTREENKRFESALAIHDKDTPDRWLKVAAMIPGKTVYDVIKQYRELEEDIGEIEAGRVPIPGYLPSPFTFELVDHQNYDAYRKRPVAFKASDHERKKGVPWTEEEHRRFLMGLLKYGKGDWRNISRNFVVTKTPTQVASHAQKYYIRQKLSSGGNNKRRPSIHDITIVNLTESTTPQDNKPVQFNDQSPMFSPHQKPNNDEVFNPNCDGFLHSSSSDIDCVLHEAFGYANLKSQGFRANSGDFGNPAVLGIHAL